jgi:hypothetical protein
MSKGHITNFAPDSLFPKENRWSWQSKAQLINITHILRSEFPFFLGELLERELYNL